MLKLYIFAPDKPEIVEKIIDVASSAGAGVMGNYSHCAFVSKGTGSWFAKKGAHPTIGKVGELTTSAEVRIEMECPEEIARNVEKAIRKVHPYEEPAIEFLKIEDMGLDR